MGATGSCFMHTSRRDIAFTYAISFLNILLLLPGGPDINTRLRNMGKQTYARKVKPDTSNNSACAPQREFPCVSENLDKFRLFL